MNRAATNVVTWIVLLMSSARAELPQPILLKPVSPTLAIDEPNVSVNSRAANASPTVESSQVAPRTSTSRRQPRIRSKPEPLPRELVNPVTPVESDVSFSARTYRAFRQGSDNSIRRSDEIFELRRSGFSRGERINRELYWLRTGRRW